MRARAVPRPRAATSVASMMGFLPALNSCRQAKERGCARPGNSHTLDAGRACQCCLPNHTQICMLLYQSGVLILWIQGKPSSVDSSELHLRKTLRYLAPTRKTTRTGNKRAGICCNSPGGSCHSGKATHNQAFSALIPFRALYSAGQGGTLSTQCRSSRLLSHRLTALPSRLVTQIP